MPNYELNRLGDKEFERMSQSLLKMVIGSGTITFGEGPDGGREATFNGKAPYPSQTDQWSGEWIFQVKFHDTETLGTDNARKQVLADLKAELDKIVNKFKRRCNNYILITNVPLSSVSGSGTHDRIADEIIPKFVSNISNIHVWGADDIFRLLEKYSSVRQAYLHFLTPGDLIAELMDKHIHHSSELATVMKLYMATSFKNEQYAQLDQAGKVDDDALPLQKVFIDLDVEFREIEDFEKYKVSEDTIGLKPTSISSLKLLLSEKLSKVVLIGGPGEGKSTLGQYLAQIHRATLLDKLKELQLESESELTPVPLVARIPFRLLLKDYAQWISNGNDERILEFYICERVQKLTGHEIFPKSIQHIFMENPCLLVLDGLDEVMEQHLRSQMLSRIVEFLERCEQALKANLQVLATTRPMGYSDQFDPKRFVHLQLTKLEPPKIQEYVAKWSRAKQIDVEKAHQLAETIKECLNDHHIRFLMKTPLQVSILIIIVLIEGTPPKQREELFNEYLEVIYRREKAKAKTIMQTSKQLLFGLHEYLGYILHSRSFERDVSSTLKRSEFIEHVRTFLKFKNPQWNAETLNKYVDLIVREANERLVLIVGLQDGTFGFELRSLQEFFAAAHLTNAKDSIQRYKRFEAVARSAHWRNVALFFAGRVGRIHSAEAATILEVCRSIDRSKPDKFLRRGEILALALAADQSFESDGRLQRSAIDYGLALTNLEPKDERINEVLTTLKELPHEDICDHVMPLLKDKMISLSMPYSESAMDLYKKLHFANEPLLELINDLFDSSKHQDVLFAIKKCVEYKIDPYWVHPHLAEHMLNISPELFVEYFGEACLVNPLYIYDCLVGFHLKEEYLIYLSNYASSFYNSISLLHGDISIDVTYVSRDFNLDSSNAGSYVFFALHIIALLIKLSIDISFGSSYSIVDGIHFSRSAYEGYPNARGQLLEKLLPYYEILSKAKRETMDQQSYLIFFIELVSWIFHFLMKPEDISFLDAFARFITKWKIDYPWVMDVLGRYGKAVHPFLPLLLESIAVESPELLADVRYLLAEFHELSAISGVFQTIREFFKRTNDVLTRDQITGLILLRKTTNEAEKKLLEAGLIRPFNVSVNTFLRLTTEYCSYTISPAPKVLRTKEVLILLEEISEDVEKNIEVGAKIRAIRLLCYFPWPTNDQVFYKAEALLTLLISKLQVKFEDLNRAICILFLKLLDISSMPENLVVSVLRLASKLEDEDLIRITFEAKHPDLILNKLNRFLKYSDTEIACGAAILMYIALTELHAEHKAKVKEETTLDLIQSSNSSFKKLGIIFLANFPQIIENNSRRVLNWIMKCQNKQEAEAWSTFIQNVELKNNREDSLKMKEFIEMLLERKSKLMPTIVETAIEQYRVLVTSEDSENLIDEKALGLPFNEKE